MTQKHLLTQSNNLFQDPVTLGHSTEWQAMLSEGLGSTPLYLWDDDVQDGVAISVFKYAFFRIGFVGFPFGGTAKGKALTDSWLEKLRIAQSELPLHAIRVIGSPFLENLSIPSDNEATWETAVLNLPDWSMHSLSSSVRRAVRKAEKSGILIKTAQIAKDSAALYQIYKQTIIRHKGTQRYTEKYFSSLVQFSLKNTAVQCYIAILHGEVIGFLITARPHNIVFYLHGGINFKYQSNRPSDLLFAHAIQSAKNEGATQFNFMASPISQLSLVRFKEKWGGTTLQQGTFNITKPTVGGKLFNTAFTLYTLKQKWKLRKHE